MTQITKAVKEERAHRAAAVAEEMHRAYLNGCVGQTYPVLFEQPKNGKFAGHAPNYMEVLAEGAESAQPGAECHDHRRRGRVPCWGSIQED